MQSDDIRKVSNLRLNDLKDAGLVSPAALETGKYHIPTPETKQRPERFGVSTYRSISWIMGFKEPFSLLLFIIFGGALVGFCLARSMMMNPKNVRTLTQPGEWFWYSKPLFKPNIFLHIYLTIIGGIFAVFQFIPAIRRRWILLHRLNGYGTVVLVIVGSVCGSIVARHSFGGEINVQSAFYTLGIMIVSSAILGYINVKNTREHRRWMLRSVVYLSSPVTARLTMLAARRIITDIGTFFVIWRCDEYIFAVQNITAVEQLYPECVPKDPGVFLGGIHIAVHASTREQPVNFASAVRLTFGMALWIGTLLHVIGVELYLRKTESSNQVRRGYVLGPFSEDTD